MPSSRAPSDASPHPSGPSGRAHGLAPLDEAGERDTEQAWISVIRKMDETYAELLAQQVELESKNEALEEAQAFIAGIMASMTDVLIACDLSGRIEQVNVAAERLFGQPGSALQDMRLADLIDPSSPTQVADVFAIVAQRQRIVDTDFAFATPEGPLPVSVNGAVRFDSRGRAVGVVLMGRPVGELRKAYRDLAAAHEGLKQAQQQLVHAEKMASLGRLVAGVAHELNNPISFVYGNAHALKRYTDRITAFLDAVERGAGPAELKALRASLKLDHSRADLPATLAGILEGAERVRDIVADLRRFSADRREALEIFEMGPLVRSALDWVAKAQMPEIDSRIDLPDGLEVEGHPGHLHQLVMNLIQNAMDAVEGRPDRRLEISGAVEGDRVVLAVRDTGPGLPEEVACRMFDPFFTTKPVGKGTGLGLSISYRIAAEHGGALAATNHPQGGAVLTLSLPAANRDGPRAPATRSLT